ncbi:MAG: hypothetical protein HOI35_15925, partial [Woeseia sp.]|nr:hypothetical protein [Woeseia sp.]
MRSYSATLLLFVLPIIALGEAAFRVLIRVPMRRLLSAKGRLARRVVLLSTLFVLPIASFAHHNPNVHYDRNEEVEIVGILTEVNWRSPHVQLTVTVTEEDGTTVEWHLDEDSHIALSRRGVGPDQYPLGETIRVAGFRGRRNQNAMFVTNTLLADGRELIAGQSSGPRWNGGLVISEESYQENLLADSSEDSTDLFRVWSHDLTGDLEGGVVRGLWNDTYPLTNYARTTQENWDEIADNPFIHCQNSLPAIMDSPNPMEFVRDGEYILLRHEELGVSRRFHLMGEPAERVSSPYGVAIGHWEDDTLVVVTTAVDFPWFDQAGIPQSEDLELVERFTVSEDNRYLHYSVTATDPKIFTEP